MDEYLEKSQSVEIMINNQDDDESSVDVKYRVHPSRKDANE